MFSLQKLLNHIKPDLDNIQLSLDWKINTLSKQLGKLTSATFEKDRYDIINYAATTVITLLTIQTHFNLNTSASITTPKDFDRDIYDSELLRDLLLDASNLSNMLLTTYHDTLKESSHTASEADSAKIELLLTSLYQHMVVTYEFSSINATIDKEKASV